MTIKANLRPYLLNIFLLLSTLFICFLLILGLDLYAHAKFLNMSGLNYKGYRGEVVKNKEGNEIRLVMLGGSTAYGYGVRYNEAVPAELEAYLQKRFDERDPRKKISVVNLAYNNEGAYAFINNLKDFSYLDYDYAVIYDGYNDLSIANTTTFRHSDPVFRTFGYMPILPLVIKEKIMTIRSGGSLEDAYRGKKVVFEPNKKDIIKMAVLNGVLDVCNKTENVIGRLNKVKDADFDREELKRDRWAWYKYYMKKTVDYTLAKNKKIIIITQPYLNDSHVEQQRALQEMLMNNYKDSKDVIYINLGKAISLEDKELTLDGMHLTAKGCRAMAAIITEKIGDKLN